jgi:ubiquinone/menaquinone biosynthesis C-methylase UbiE
MEFGPLIRVYESRLWRRNPLFALILQISFERERRLILEAVALSGTEAVLDLACGPGIYSRAFAEQLTTGYVVGLDLSLPMLAEAATRARRFGLENLLWVHASAGDLPLGSGLMDVVNCCGALHLFPDVTRVLREIARVLKPGGRFTVATFRRREGRVSEFVASRRHKTLGIAAFTRHELESRLLQADLQAVQFHHAKGGWLIASATKPRPAPSQRSP